MIEALLSSGGRGSGAIQDPPYIGFDFSRGASTGTTPITASYGSDQIVGPPLPITGYATVLASLGRRVSIAPTSAWAVGTGDFTLVWRGLFRGTSGFVHMFWSQASGANNFGVVAQDIGYSNRLICYLGSMAHVFNINKLRTDLEDKNAWSHFVLQRKDGAIGFYIDGVKIGLSPDRGTTFSLADQPAADNVTGTTLSAITDTGYGSGYYCAEFALYKSALYNGNFTPPVGKLAT